MSDKSLDQITAKTIEYARQREYRGYNKADGMSSRILQAIPVDNKWLNILFQESAKRAPINIRPLLLVEQRRNNKGAALFALANHNMYRLSGESLYREERDRLVDWLINQRRENHSGYGVGNPHTTQMLKYKNPSDIADVVSTSYAVRALLRSDVDCLDTAISAADFIFEDLQYNEFDKNKARVKYKKTDPDGMYTMNANALGARLLLDLYAETSKERFRDRAKKILQYVASRQEPIGGWMYKDPPSASHVSMDNYHNGFIIECFMYYDDITNSGEFADVIKEGLRFYRTELYDSDGAPCWDESNRFPRDVHAAAQGIVVFAHADEISFARKIINWTLKNLYGGDGQFYYQKERYYTKTFTLMRWCQAWMAYALSEFLVKEKQST